jgi:hypothetical protein
VGPGESPLGEGRDGARSRAMGEDCLWDCTNANPSEEFCQEHHRLHCVGPDQFQCEIPGEGRAARGRAWAGLWAPSEVELVVGFSGRRGKSCAGKGGNQMTIPLCQTTPSYFSIYLLALALPRPPQPTPGWANHCFAFQALSQVSADLAAPRNGPSGPAAARTLPLSELLKAPGARRSLGEVRAGVRRAEGSQESCRSRLLPARLPWGSNQGFP